MITPPQAPESARLIARAAYALVDAGFATGNARLPLADLAEPEQVTGAALLLTMTIGVVATAAGIALPDGLPGIVAGDGRGAELARELLSGWPAEVCCDYCAELLTIALAETSVGLMEYLHGPGAQQAWQALAAALVTFPAPSLQLIPPPLYP